MPVSDPAALPGRIIPRTTLVVEVYMSPALFAFSLFLFGLCNCFRCVLAQFKMCFMISGNILFFCSNCCLIFAGKGQANILWKGGMGRACEYRYVASRHNSTMLRGAGF